VPADECAFVPLALRLRAAAAPSAAESPRAAAPPAAPASPLPDMVELARDLRLFRARLADAFEAARAALLHELAYAVLGRELVLAPPQLATIAERIIAEHPAAQPVRIRVAPSEVGATAVHAGLPPLQADAALAPGDAIVEFATGHVDARLGLRLAALLEQHG